MRSTRALCSVGGPCSRRKADCCHSLIRLSPNLCHLWRAPHEPQATAFVVRHPLCSGGRAWGPSVAQEATFPSKPITLVIPFPPGGATDVLGRLIGKKLGDKLGQSVVIDNRA